MQVRCVCAGWKKLIARRRGMKRVILCAASLIVALCMPLCAQTISGTWQGTLPAAENPRIMVRIRKADDGSLRGVLYQMDKRASGIALTSVSFAAPNLSLEQVNLGVSYRGKVSPDGKLIDGVWAQDKKSYPMTLLLATPETLWKPDGPTALAPMSPTADPAFEVATIKPSPPDAKGHSFSMRTRDFAARNRTVQDLIEWAYQVSDRQISGAPPWMTETKFDIAGKPDAEGLPSPDQYRLMIQKLLANRFQLKLHVIKQTFPVYALTRDEKAPVLPHSDPGLDTGNAYVSDSPDGQTVLHFVGMSMPMFSSFLMRFIEDRQVVDETGLTGYFEFTIKIPTSDLDSSPADSGPTDTEGDAIRRGIQPLGFKLVPKKEPIDVIVIDHLDQPSAN